MKIVEIFDQYASKMAQIHLYQRAMWDLAKKELQQLNDYALSLEDKSDLKKLSSSLSNMFFRDAKKGELCLFGRKVSSLEERYLAVQLHKNKQYQWLLAEAYEEFEDFLYHAYAFAALSDVNFWPLSDYGKISLDNLKEKDFKWYLQQVKKKHDLPHSILNQFRKKYPSISIIETKNALKINLKLAVVLIEHLRHVIVHKGGSVTDKSIFIELVLKKSGLHNNGKHKKEDVKFIKSFFGSDDYENTIVLLEIEIDQEMPLNPHLNVFDLLSGYLMAYAHVIYELLNPNTPLHSHNNAM